MTADSSGAINPTSSQLPTPASTGPVVEITLTPLFVDMLKTNQPQTPREQLAANEFTSLPTQSAPTNAQQQAAMAAMSQQRAQVVGPLEEPRSIQADPIKTLSVNDALSQTDPTIDLSQTTPTPNPADIHL